MFRYSIVQPHGVTFSKSFSLKHTSSFCPTIQSVQANIFYVQSRTCIALPVVSLILTYYFFFAMNSNVVFDQYLYTDLVSVYIPFIYD
jgi:hypothetical protein